LKKVRLRFLKFEMKDKKSNQEGKYPEKLSRIGASLSFNGELHGQEDIMIEGQVQGKIDLKNHNLKIEQGGKVKASVQVKNITINGEVDGNIYASGKVYISKEGQLSGDIYAPRISIADGAQFKGSVKMKEGIEKMPLPEEKPKSPYDQKEEQEEKLSTAEEPSK
jgi:cytoskeletal protein CcmA (bactofilin family)